MVVEFIQELELKLLQNPGARIVYMVAPGKRALSNAVFLLRAYMILKLDMTTQHVADHFDWLDDSLIEDFRDATFCPGSFRLTLEDCWGGIEKGQGLGWFKASSDGEYWGMINIKEYRHYDSSANGDFHEVVPSKFIPFKGPEDLGCVDYLDDERGCSTFSPAVYADIFAEDSVQGGGGGAAQRSAVRRCGVRGARHGTPPPRVRRLHLPAGQRRGRLPGAWSLTSSETFESDFNGHLSCQNNDSTVISACICENVRLVKCLL